MSASGATWSYGYQVESLAISPPSVVDTDWTGEVRSRYSYQIEAMNIALSVPETTWTGQVRTTYTNYKPEALTITTPAVITSEWVQYIRSTYSNYKPEGVVVSAPVVVDSTWT